MNVIKRLYENNSQQVFIEITDAGYNFYFVDIYFREKNTNKKLEKYNGISGIYEGEKNLKKSINGFIKRHNLLQVK